MCRLSTLCITAKLVRYHSCSLHKHSFTLLKIYNTPNHSLTEPFNICKLCVYVIAYLLVGTCEQCGIAKRISIIVGVIIKIYDVISKVNAKSHNEKLTSHCS